MKKLFALLLATLMLVAFTACGNETTEPTNDDTAATTTTAPAPEAEPAPAPLEVLNTVWNNYDEANKFFAMGGDYGTLVENAPGAVDVTNYDNFGGLLVCPAEAAGMIDDAASLVHSMNANTFTGAAYHLADASNKDAFVTAMQDAINGNQWMCGFPDKLIIAVVGGEYVLLTFGVNDAINPFETKLAAAYPDAVIAYNEAITG